MKKALLLICMMAFFGTIFADTWDDNQPTDGIVVFTVDHDGPKTNIRSSAGGKVVYTIGTDSTFTFIMKDGMKAVNGWVRIPDDCLYWYDEDADGHNVEIEKYGLAKQRIKLTGSTTGYWIHSSKLQVMIFSEAEIRKEANKSSEMVYKANNFQNVIPLEYKNGWLKVQTLDKKYTGWMNEEWVAQHSLLFNTDCTCGEGEEYVLCMGNTFYGKYFVNGGIGIRQFVEAVSLTPDNKWAKTPTFDAKNGFFSYSNVSTDENVSYNGAYWNRKDGSKLFIVSYTQNIIKPDYDSENDVDIDCKWGKATILTSADKDGNIRYKDTGFRAFLYDAKEKALVALEEVPFKGMPETKLHRFLELPQQGYDIRIREFDPKQSKAPAQYHTLKWNGMTFDYVK